MTAGRLTSLEAARKDGRELDFWGLNEPKCPHCGYDYDIQEHGAWDLYEEGEHEIECQSCNLSYAVSVSVSFSYSTDKQEDEEE